MNSQKGVTLTSLVIYMTILLIVLGTLAVISGTFQGNIKEIYVEGTNNAEIDKFNVYFLKEVKKQGNEIKEISNAEIAFISGNKYTFDSDEQCIYLNNGMKIAENIENCSFEIDSENEKVIKVTIKATMGEEKQIEYVLSNKNMNNSYENENDYTYENVLSNDIS